MTAGLMISAPASGVGKTTLTLALARAYRNRGLQVQCLKSGPDYIDPAFHDHHRGPDDVVVEIFREQAGPVQRADKWILRGAGKCGHRRDPSIR